MSNNLVYQQVPNHYINNAPNMPDYPMTQLGNSSGGGRINVPNAGNYPDEWMHNIPEPTQYVEMPVNMAYDHPPQFISNQVGSPENGVYQERMYNMRMDMSAQPDIQKGNGVMPNMYVNEYQDDCLFMNLEEEYLHKVSMQNKGGHQINHNINRM